MEDNASYDPLLGHVQERLANRRKPARTKAKQDRGDGDLKPTSPSDDRLRDASHALNLRDVAAAGWLYWITSSTLNDQINAEAFVMYRNLLLKEAGDPSDPIERMMIEQLALSHFAIGQLRIKSCSVESPKLAVAFADSATKLLAEFRRSSLALQEYRAKQIAQTEASGSTDSAAEEAPTKLNGHVRPSSNGRKKQRDTELGSNGNGEMPEWLKKRMAYPTPNGSKSVAATAGNGKA